MHLTLLPFSEDHSLEITSWPRDADELKAWAGADTEFPFRTEQFLELNNFVSGMTI